MADVDQSEVANSLSLRLSHQPTPTPMHRPTIAHLSSAGLRRLTCCRRTPWLSLAPALLDYPQRQSRVHPSPCMAATGARGRPQCGPLRRPPHGRPLLSPSGCGVRPTSTLALLTTVVVGPSPIISRRKIDNE
jgi:hypothetical protein